MIKLTVEIKNEKFVYEYEVGSSKQHGEIDICPDSLEVFTAILRTCSYHHHSDYQKFRDEITAKAWVETNLEEAKKVIQRKEKP